MLLRRLIPPINVTLCHRSGVSGQLLAEVFPRAPGRQGAMETVPSAALVGGGAETLAGLQSLR